MQGVEEESAEFRIPVDLKGPGRFRRIAGIGPAYEIIGIEGLKARVRLVDGDEEFDYPLADAELDPFA